MQRVFEHQTFQICIKVKKKKQKSKHCSGVDDKQQTLTNFNKKVLNVTDNIK